MAFDFSHIWPIRDHADFVWLGKQNWLEYQEWPGDNIPRTAYRILPGLATTPGAEQHYAMLARIMRCNHHDAERNGSLELPLLETFGRLLADGPKLFQPTEEQFESMMEVEIHIHARDFYSPYPALVIEVPATARRRLEEQTGMTPGRGARFILVRHTHGAVHPVILVTTLLKGVEVFYLLSQETTDPEIEVTLNRIVPTDCTAGESGPDDAFGLYAARAVLNLCLMLTHFGHREPEPLDPIAYKKHRTNKNLAHLKHGDFLAVNLNQEIVVRAHKPSINGGTGEPTGREMPPHWRRGHWRRKPGHEAFEARGEKPPLILIKPAFIRADRLVGDLSETQATYRVK